MNYTINPPNFKPEFNVVGILVEFDGKIILLHRNDSSPQGNRWGIPSGKVDKNETLIQATERELKEETNLSIKRLEIKYIKTYKVRHYPQQDFIYNLFYVRLEKKERIKINEKEHKDFKWIFPQKAIKLNLVPGTEICINDFYKL